ncbi:MAG: 23S rRNA (uracil(1939)-C(5))-methyltransferase RlmD [Clostridiales bacterium]|nr:23S rRNA (uracil(1939)-C(5))-methyltransferase RlmD [Clostridiales bacterium]
MKKNEQIQLEIQDRNFPNKGLASYQGYKVVVKDTLPGQIVEAKIKKKKNGVVECSLQQIVKKADYEIDPGCSHYGTCGGCAYQTLTKDKEMSLKESQVRKLLMGVGVDESCFEGIIAAPNWTGYRNKCEFSFGDEQKDGDLALGMRKKGSYYEVVTLKDCNIIDKDYIKIIQVTLDFFRKNKVPFYHKARHDGVLRHLVVRKGTFTGEILINLITANENCFSITDYVNTLLSETYEGKICGILHTKNNSIADIVQSDYTEVVFGQDYFNETLLGLKFRVTAFSFFQTNSAGAELLYSIVQDYVGNTKDKIVFDLYCGTGTISQLLSSKAKKVVGIEIVEEAVEAAKENTRTNQIENCDFIAGDVLKVVDTLEDKPDIIVVDPPREGIHPKAIGKIIGFGADEIIYVSCKPTSLANDLREFMSAGYQVKKVKMVNQFPRTVHVETVCLLSKLNTKQHIEVEIKMDELDLTAAESKATYDEIKAYMLEKHGLKVSSLYISQVKRKCGLDVGQNYNLSKKEDAKVPQCPPEKEAAIMDALKHFQMI